MKQKQPVYYLISIMTAFFVMGFVDLVGIATNYAKVDFELSNKVANLLPSMVFLWFLIFSVPTGILMNKIGRKKTVELSLIITLLSLSLPILNYTFPSLLISFSLLGIGNTLMQVSINPLLSDIVKGDKLASSITFGQFVKAIASFLAPVIATWASTTFGDWRILFPIFMLVALTSVLLLGLSHINESKEKKQNPLSFSQCFGLLADKVIFFSFIGIICHVGVDVGINVSAPRILMERLNMTLDDAGIACSLYFIFRTIGCFMGAILLTRLPVRSIFVTSVLLMAASIVGLMIADNMPLLYISISLIGLGNSNIFPIILSQAMLYKPDKKNEVSGLMIMGIVGGSIFPFLMGVSSDIMGSQTGAIAIIGIGVLYLLIFAARMKKRC